MHILIIPSEEFVPVYNKLDGIFQYHQASILKEAGYKVGALSVRLSFSVLMIFKGLLFKATGGKAGNATDNFSFPDLLKIGLNKFFNAHKFVTVEVIDGIPVCRVDGLYFRQPANNKNHFSWVKAGMTCFSEYLKQYGRPDIIHAHDAIYAGMLAAKIHEKFGLAYIITEHSSTYALKKADAEIVNHVKKAHKNAVALYAVSETFA
ncbi:MAG: glycosyltransferase, partial [Ferruginibacter sp.]